MTLLGTVAAEGVLVVVVDMCGKPRIKLGGPKDRNPEMQLG